MGKLILYHGTPDKIVVPIFGKLLQPYVVPKKQ